MSDLRFFYCITLGLVLFTSRALQGQSLEDEAISVSDSIQYDYFSKHLRYLASDALKGRGVGTPEYERAGNYLASEFKKNELLPFGAANSYFQQVALSELSLQDEAFSLSVKNGSAIINGKYGTDVSVVLNPNYQKVDTQQQLVFVGYGNIIPEQNIDDYDGVDVKGKTVIVALGGPNGIKHPDFDDRNAKFKNAVLKGASGLILFYPKASLFQDMIFKRVHAFLSEGMLTLSDTSVKSLVTVDLEVLLFAKKGWVRDLFRINGLNLGRELRNMARGYRSSQRLTATLGCSYTVRNKAIHSKNIVGVLPGTDPKLKNEYVVLGAHLDGLGIGETVKGDSIYNGMLDNASGVAALLSISKAFSELSEPPKRAILFIGYTAEESGLLGSSYFAAKNGIVDGKIVAKINIDMLAQTIETKDMAPLGYAHSNLSEGADFAAKNLNLKIDNNEAAEVRYIARSDQLSFIKKGIPSLFISAGFTALDPRKNGEKVFAKWMKKRYDSPFDDLHQEYSEKAFLKAVKFNFLTVFYIANTLEKIEWNTNGWLYKKYVQTER
ncbi:MAG: M28 family peptidase [Bacteroidota bacterium]